MRMKILFFISCVLIFSPVFTQLETKIIQGKYGDSTLTFHENHQISTIDFHITDRLSKTIVYNSNGKELFQGEHGYQYGSHGLDIKFYPNGQVASIRKTFQPDGGIQYDDHAYFYDEDGTFIREEDYSLPTQLITQPTPTTYQQEIIRETSTPPKMDSIKLFIKNTTQHKIKLLVRSKTTQYDWIVKIKKNQTSFIGSYLDYSNQLPPDNYYEVIILPKKKKQFSILKQTSLDSSVEKYWVILL